MTTQETLGQTSEQASPKIVRGEEVSANMEPRRLDWTARIGAFASLFSAIAALVGLFLVVQQLRHASEAINANTLEQIYSRMHDINKMFVEHPELKPYFYGNLDINDPNPLIEDLGLDPVKVRAQVSPLAELMCDFFAQALIELKHLPPEPYEGWLNYMQAVYMQSPALRQYYNANKEWYQYAEAAALFDEAELLLKEQNKESSNAATQ